MPVHLLSLTDGPSILVDKPILLFGRHEECDVQLHSKKVSRRHCCVAQVNDYLVVRDLGSTNGVKVNGLRVAEGKLVPGDELTIGNFKYQVCGDVLGGSTERPPVPKGYGTIPPDNGTESSPN
ncbi:MAG: FHA domain-containing protein [Gemmataceae bacterium]